MPDTSEPEVLQARLVVAQDDLRHERQKVLLLIQIIDGLAKGDIDPANIEVSADGTQVQLRNADLVPAEGN